MVGQPLPRLSGGRCTRDGHVLSLSKAIKCSVIHALRVDHGRKASRVAWWCTLLIPDTQETEAGVS